MSENQKSSNLTKILIGVAVVQLGIIIFLAMKLSSSNNEVEKLSGTVAINEDVISQKTKELESLSNDFERIKKEREQLGLVNDDLEKQLTTLNSAIADLKKSKNLDSSKRKELEQLVASLRAEISKQDQEIASLKAANDSLTTDVSNLTKEKSKLGDSLNNVAMKKSDLEGKLKFASILKAEQFKITVLKENGKEIEDDDYKASKINRVKITFRLVDNKAAKQESKDFFMRLIVPGGDSFSDVNNGGGTTTLSDGTQINYTMKQTLTFDNSGQNMVFITFAGMKYVEGEYKTEIFCDGFKIGSGTFKVR
ncbi:MAG: hypothetical protein EAZ27_12430 [Cytophagales bacterium]|nr:MAG: hypothetical protein EAZ27_12430 [Cytophagales bacterium]